MYVVTVFQVYSKSNEWKLLARWSVSFCNETKVYDATDSKLLNLVSAVCFLFLSRVPSKDNNMMMMMMMIMTIIYKTTTLLLISICPLLCTM